MAKKSKTYQSMEEYDALFNGKPKKEKKDSFNSYYKMGEQIAEGVIRKSKPNICD